MFGEGPAVGFIPTPVIDLRAGNLYNIVISLLVFLGCTYAGWTIFSRGKRGLLEKTFTLFLYFVGIYWLLAAFCNLLAWFNMLSSFAWLAYIIKFASVLPQITLAYYFATEIFENKTIIRRLTFIYTLIAAGYLVITFRQDLTNHLVAYWGVQWQVSALPFLIYMIGLLFPLGLSVVYLIIKGILTSLAERKTVNLTLYLGGIIFILLEYLQTGTVVVTWQRLLLRLFYILIAFGAYLYFVGRIEERKFIPREEVVVSHRMLRLPFFAKLLFLFIFLVVIPITISSLLMFVSFKEIIDLYIYKPLLWNLKASGEAFLMALEHVQVQVLFLMILTSLLVILTSTIVSRAIAGSLRRVSQGMERVSKGDFSFKLLPDSNDEIGDVVNYFNNMSLEIKRARDLMENWNRELEIKVAERTEDLRKALARLTELDRMKNEFISMVSHELRTPVTSADGYVSLFLAGVTGPLTDDQKNYLTIVRKNNQRLLTLINRLLDLSQIEAGRFVLKRELVSMHGIINSTVDIMKPQLEKKQASLSLKLEAPNDNFMGDRERMSGVLINLIENGLKFSKEGETPAIEIITENEDGFIKVMVADNGVGIEKEYLERIFERFYQIEDTLTRRAGGVGLGLSLVKEIIEGHSGKIWAKSEGLGRGARFIFIVPAAEKIV